MEINDELKIETYKRLGEIGVLGLKTGFLLNGGAAIAILTFVGNIVQTDKNLAGELAWSIEKFVAGIVCTAVAVVLTYIMQLRLFREYVDALTSRHPCPLRIAVALVLTSIGLFCWGAIVAMSAFK